MFKFSKEKTIPTIERVAAGKRSFAHMTFQVSNAGMRLDVVLQRSFRLHLYKDG